MSTTYEQRHATLINDVEIARERLNRYRRGRTGFALAILASVLLALGGLVAGTVTAAVGINLQAGPTVAVLLGLISVAGSGIGSYMWRENHSKRITDKSGGSYQTKFWIISPEERLDQAQAEYREYVASEASD